MRLRQRCHRAVTVLVVLLVLVTPFSALVRPSRVEAATPAATLYDVTDLGTLGGKNSAAVAINGRQQVVGWAETDPATDDVFHAFRWEAGQITDLGTLGGSQSMATAINDDGVIAGWAENIDGKRRAVLWRDTSILDLGSLGGDQSGAEGINAQGQIVGWSTVTPGSDDAHAFLWDGGTMVELGTINDQASRAFAITDHGQMVGFVENSDGAEQAVTWTGSEMAALPGAASYARALNDHGQIAGGAIGDSQPHAALWDKSGIIDLGTLGGRESYATGIDNTGRVVGGAFSVAEVMRAFVWDAGTMRDLGTLGGWRSSAAAIGSDGSIAGWATTSSDDQRASLWTIVPSPAQPVATPAPANENLLFGINQNIEGTSALAACAGAATWLAGTATNVDPIFLPLFPDSSSGSHAEFRAVLDRAHDNLERSQPPPAGKALQVHIDDMLQRLQATTRDADTGTNLLGVVSADGQFLTDLLEFLALSRQLKRDCNLVYSPQFFDAACYGMDAAEWYSRTYARWMSFADTAVTMQEGISAGDLNDETTQDFITRATAEYDPFLRAQIAEDAPPAMQGLQQRYVDLFALLTSMWQTVMSGQQSLDQARYATAALIMSVHREAARLDISCQN